MTSFSWLVRLLLVQSLLLLAAVLAIPVVNNTALRIPLQIADILQGPVDNTAAEEYDDSASHEANLNDSIETKVNSTHDLKQYLLLTPDAMETLEGYMQESDTSAENYDSDTLDGSGDGSAHDSNRYVVRLARALERLCPETVVLNSVEVIEHTHDHHRLNPLREPCIGRFAVKEKPPAHEQPSQKPPSEKVIHDQKVSHTVEHHYHHVPEMGVFQLPISQLQQLPANRRHVRNSFNHPRSKPTAL